MGTDKFYLSLFGPGRDTHHRCRTGTLSLITFDPSGTLPLERIYSVFLFTAGLSLKLKWLEELVTALTIMHNIIRAGGEEVIPT
jgi:hypothetical protein